MMERLAVKTDTIDKLVNEIVDTITDTKKLNKLLRIIEEKEDVEKKNSNEILSLRKKVDILESRLNKLIRNFETTAVEAERDITDRYEKVLEHIDDQIVHLQGQIENLRTSLIRISNEVKNLKERL
jgi:chromosome segregation ATPase